MFHGLQSRVTLRCIDNFVCVSCLKPAVYSAIFPSHVQTEEKRAKVISMFVGFRNYLHYHIKASKTYLHMRMRSRVTSLLQGQKSMLGRTHA